MMPKKRNFLRDWRIDMNNNVLRIAGLTPESVVDGPGLRYVILTQGCPHRCGGCHNPATHDFAGGYDITLEELVQAIDKVKLIDGITLSGGEPFAQAAACAKLAQLVKQRGLSVVTYSGYYYADLLAMAKNDPAITNLLQFTDILIDGPYDETKKNLYLPFRGSSNQNIIVMSDKNLNL